MYSYQFNFMTKSSDDVWNIDNLSITNVVNRKSLHTIYQNCFVVIDATKLI